MSEFWRHVEKQDNGSRRGLHYGILSLNGRYGSGMDALKTMFPEGEANEMNFVIFSTSGVHGTYATIEEVERGEVDTLTFLVVHPRLVTLRYGNCLPKSEDDFAFLKKLRDSSLKAVSEIGK